MYLCVYKGGKGVKKRKGMSTSSSLSVVDNSCVLDGTYEGL
jgi:hypothetical protein